MAHLSGYGDVVEDGDEDENGCSDEQGGEECCRLESVVEVAQKGEIASACDDGDGNGCCEHQQIEHDGEHEEGPYDAARRVAYEEQIVDGLRILLQDEEDAEQEHIEREDGDDESYDEHDGGDDAHEAGGSRGVGIGGLSVVPISVEVGCYAFVGWIVDLQDET